MANKTIKGERFETYVVTDKKTTFTLDKNADIFYGGKISTGDEDTAPSLLFGYGIVEDIASKPSIARNTYAINGHVTGLFGAVSTHGDNTTIKVGKTADLNAGLGIGLDALTGMMGDGEGGISLSIGTVSASGDASRISIAKGADIGGLIGVGVTGNKSVVANSGDIHTGILGMLGGDLSVLTNPEDAPTSTGKLTLTNNGSIESAIGIMSLAMTPDASVSLVNGKGGDILAGIMGLGVMSIDGAKSTITNAGTIRVTVSLEVDPDLGIPLPISSAAVFGYMGKETLVNTGKIYGDVALGAGNDTVDNSHGMIKGKIFGDLGDDMLIVGSAKDKLTEMVGAGFDTVKSAFTYKLNANVDALVLTGSKDINGTGNELDNRLTGNAGNNTLTGDLGLDTFVFGSKGGRDTIADFTVADDTLDLSKWKGMVDFAFLEDHAKIKQGDVVITVGKDVLVIADHAIADLSAANIDYAV